MFNGVIFKTGVVKIIKKYKKSILIGVKTRSKFSSKDLQREVYLQRENYIEKCTHGNLQREIQKLTFTDKKDYNIDINKYFNNYYGRINELRDIYNDKDIFYK